MKSGIVYMMGGVAATLMVQQLKNGNLQKWLDKKMKAEKKMLDDLEDMV